MELQTYKKSESLTVLFKRNCNVDSLLLKFEDSQVRFDLNRILDTKSMEDYAYLNAILRFLPFDKEAYFVEKAGRLDVPKINLLAISYCDKSFNFHLGSCSFYSIFYSHYFSDYVISNDLTSENSDKNITLRSLLEGKIKKYLKLQVEKFIQDESKQIIFFPGLPNPLGITGVIQLNDKFLLRKRNNNLLENKTLDWSFSGLIESSEFFDYFLSDKDLSVYELIEGEFIDEVLRGLFKEQLNSDQIVVEKIIPLGLVFNSRMLYQPEFVVYVKCCVNREIEPTNNISMLSMEELIDLPEIKDSYKFKNIFFDVYDLFSLSFEKIKRIEKYNNEVFDKNFSVMTKTLCNKTELINS